MHSKIKPLNRKGAIELSVGTIVVIVLAMSMLILGLVLIRTIFVGSKYNVDQLNKNVEAEINKLFNERGDKIVLYLANNQADVKQGKSYGVAFGVRNTVEGESEAGKFSYKVQASDVQKGCQISLQQADNYLILGSTGTFSLAPGQIRYNLVKTQPSSSSPLCEIRYDISVTKDNQPYDSTFFIVKITS
ncbi:hypothetical protein HYW75_06690 [Candidatus Pacearchaeota archaeon]|nr:hypothetical protein [Candidatus Pacearchaeota archaeon]